jgi:hypothetical protein
LIQYSNDTIGLCKDIIFGSIEKKLLDIVETVESAETVLDTLNGTVDTFMDDIGNIKKEIEDKINQEWVAHITSKIKTAIEKFDSIDVKGTVDVMIAKLDKMPEIQKTEGDIAKEIESQLQQTRSGTVTIFDFYKNYKQATTALLEKWAADINAAIPDIEDKDEYYKSKCLLNVLDLRLTSLIQHFCEINKPDNLLCDDEIIKDIDAILTKNDIKAVYKNIIVRTLLITKNELLGNVTFFEESIVYYYLFDSKKTDNNSEIERQMLQQRFGKPYLNFTSSKKGGSKRQQRQKRQKTRHKKRR